MTENEIDRIKFNLKLSDGLVQNREGYINILEKDKDFLLNELEKRDRQIKGLISELRSGYRACGVSDSFTESKIQSIMEEGNE